MLLVISNQVKSNLKLSCRIISKTSTVKTLIRINKNVLRNNLLAPHLQKFQSNVYAHNLLCIYKSSTIPYPCIAQTSVFLPLLFFPNGIKSLTLILIYALCAVQEKK